MRANHKAARCVAWAFGAALAAPFALAPAAAQSMSPMLGEVRSLTDHFLVRVRAQNPYRHRIRVHVRVYDARFRPVRAQVRPASFLLGGGAQRPVQVRVPFDGAGRRRVRVCTESIPFPNRQIAMRSQICGRFLATRVR